MSRLIYAAALPVCKWPMQSLHAEVSLHPEFLDLATLKTE